MNLLGRTNIENFSQSVAKQSFSANSTVLARKNRRVRTVEHLMAALYMAGISKPSVGSLKNVQ